MKNSPKMAILQSLEALDQMQMEEVLNYIKGIIAPTTGTGYKAFKKEAMKEIRQALKKGKNGFQLSA